MAIYDMAQMELASMTKSAEPAPTPGAAAAEIAGKLADPAIIVAMGPQSGLQVTPVTFQSVEQEGRWKPAGLLDPGAAQGPVSTPPPEPIPNSLGRAFEINSRLPGSLLYSFKGVGSRKFGKLKRLNAKLFTLSCNGGGEVVIDATWWTDGAEIYGGFAGMASAKGFGSVYNDMASVTLQATPFGNYYPAMVLITWTGWLNPVGPIYKEFRGALVISADGLGPNLDPNGHAPGFMEQWDRGQNPYEEAAAPAPIPWKGKDGFVLEVESLLKSVLHTTEEILTWVADKLTYPPDMQEGAD